MKSETDWAEAATAKERWGHRELREAGRTLPPTFQGQRSPTEPLIMQCWPPELWENKGLCPSRVSGLLLQQLQVTNMVIYTWGESVRQERKD